MIARIRKAVMAGASAALAVAITQFSKDGAPSSGDGWAGFVAALLAAFVVAAAATYTVRNAGTVNGSDPAPGTSPTSRPLR